MYKLFIRPILFCFDPEKVHYFTFSLIKNVCKIPFVPRLFEAIYGSNDKNLEVEVFGLTFPNRVGLAAGFDKNAELFNEFSHFGFGCVEIGTVTPVAQDGNPKKRLFRLKADQAIINRMGFNNRGVASAVSRLKKRKTAIIIGGNIGKNKDTPNENALSDYQICFEALYDYVDYFTVNVSSPNTANLRALQEKEPLKNLLFELQKQNKAKASPKPILLKIAPDLNNNQLLDIIEIVTETQIAGVIATNTTLARTDLKSDNQTETGGLSGKPLTNRSTEVIRFLAQNSQNSFSIVGVGGIHSVQDAMDKLDAGASLVQLYTGFIYEGPALVKAINKKILERKHKLN